MTIQKECPLRLFASVSLCLLATLGGCANPGTPQPPSLHLPRPVSDLQAQRVGNNVQLRWTMPDDTTDGLALEGQKKVTICRRAGVGVCEQVQSFPEMPKAKISIEDALPAALAKGSPVLLTYEVEVLNAVGRSAGTSNPAYTASGAAPAAAGGLHAAVTERGVVLHWQLGDDTGSEILVRRERLHSAAVPAEKKSTSAENPKAPENPLAPRSEPDVQMLRVHGDAGGTLDASAVFGEQYTYTVQRVKRLELAGQKVEVRSEPDVAVTVDVRDVFPPLAPQGLAAAEPARSVDGGFAVDLSWEANTEPDLAGYIVYRYVTTGKTGPERMNAELLPAPAFHDAGLRAGLGYAYSVVAVDKSGNESKRSVGVDVNVPQ